MVLIIHRISQVSIGINIGHIINLYQDWLLLIILVSILVIVTYYHPVQTLAQIYIIADITGCKKDTKTVSYLFCYLFLIYHVYVFNFIVWFCVSSVLKWFNWINKKYQIRNSTQSATKNVKIRYKINPTM